MHEIDRRIGLTRLLLADIATRIAQKEETAREYEVQMRRIVEATVIHAGDVGQGLAAMAEVEERLAEVAVTHRHLARLRERATRELEALLLTKRVADATAQIAELESRRATLQEQLAALGAPEPAPAAGAADADEAEALRALNAQVSAQIAALQRLISEVSQRAARSISTPP